MNKNTNFIVYEPSYFLLNIPKTSYVYHIYHHNHLLQIGSSYCLFNYEKKSMFEKIIAIMNVNQSDAIVVLTLLFLT